MVAGAVCHGPAGLINVMMENGIHLVNGRRVAAFTNEEEVAAGKDKVNPFFIADPLVTGQNPASAAGVAKEKVELLAEPIHQE